MALTLSDLGRMRDVVEVEEGDPAGGRVVRLVAGPGKAAAAAAETAHCEVHWPAGRQAPGLEQLPSVVVELQQLAERVRQLVAAHGGSLPLASLPHCYALQFPPLLAVPGEEGVPLEHLLQAVKDVSITTVVTGIKRLVESAVGQPEFQLSDADLSTARGHISLLEGEVPEREAARAGLVARLEELEEEGAAQLEERQGAANMQDKLPESERGKATADEELS